MHCTVSIDWRIGDGQRVLRRHRRKTAPSTAAEGEQVGVTAGGDAVDSAPSIKLRGLA
jgi:hypothetical protein